MKNDDLKHNYVSLPGGRFMKHTMRGPLLGYVCCFPTPSNYPIGSMYGTFNYIWVIYGINVSKYSSTMDHLGMVITTINSNMKF